MKIQSFPAPPFISNYVSSIFVMEDCRLHSDAGFPLIANGYPSIVFQTTDAGLIINESMSTGNFVLFGQIIKPARLLTTGRLTVIAYFLFPHVLKTFFGFDANELTGLGIDLNLLPPAREINIKEQLLNTPSLEKRLQLLNKYVYRLSQTKYPVNQALLFAAQTIRKNRGIFSLKSMLNELRMPERTFRRLFEYQVGLSPKMFSRVCQFDTAFQQVNQKQFSKLSDIAYDNGYADQSHLIRSFKEFTSYSPTEYLQNLSHFQHLNS